MFDSFKIWQLSYRQSQWNQGSFIDLSNNVAIAGNGEFIDKNFEGLKRNQLLIICSLLDSHQPLTVYICFKHVCGGDPCHRLKSTSEWATVPLTQFCCTSVDLIMTTWNEKLILQLGGKWKHYVYHLFWNSLQRKFWPYFSTNLAHLHVYISLLRLYSKISSW